MQLRSLEVFCEIAERRSFSRAAAARGLTQSAASQIVQHLEDHLGVRLIDRSKRPLVLTPAGQLYYEGLSRIVHDYAALEDDIRSFGRRLAGRVSVAAIYSVGLSYMPDATAEFSRQHPDVEVRVEYGSPARVYEQIGSGEADLGLVSYPSGSRSIEAVLWQREPMRLICAPDHRLAKLSEVGSEDLDRLPMIGFERGLQIRREIDTYLNRRGIRPSVAMEFDNIDSLIRAIQASSGISILPETAVRRETAAGSLRVLACPDLQLTRPLGIIRRRGGRLGPATRQFAALLLGRPLDSDDASSETRRRRRPAKPPSSAVGA